MGTRLFTLHTKVHNMQQNSYYIIHNRNAVAYLDRSMSHSIDKTVFHNSVIIIELSNEYVFLLSDCIWAWIQWNFWESQE